MSTRADSQALHRDASVIMRLIEERTVPGSDERAHLSRLRTTLILEARRLWPEDNGREVGIPGQIGSHSWRVSTIDGSEEGPMIEIYAKRGSTFGQVSIRRDDAAVIASAIVNHANHALPAE